MIQYYFLILGVKRQLQNEHKTEYKTLKYNI